MIIHKYTQNSGVGWSNTCGGPLSTKGCSKVTFTRNWIFRPLHPPNVNEKYDFFDPPSFFVTNFPLYAWTNIRKTFMFPLSMHINIYKKHFIIHSKLKKLKVTGVEATKNP